MKTYDDPCFSLCEEDSGVEEPISCAVAKKDFNLCVKHGHMKTNGERRFRLNCSDGSAYIRTITAPNFHGWQNSHYHKSLRETYIVESGWIGYIEISDGQVQTKKYSKGNVFTTTPDIAHNIYMPKSTVIHTIKHCPDLTSEESDWHNKREDCKTLDEITSTSLKQNWSFNSFPHTPPNNFYSEAYRHFDNLVWQVPAWATAIFTAVIAIIATISNEDNLKSIFNQVPITRDCFSSYLLIFFGIFTLVSSYTLYRFRCHQSHVKVSQSKSISPQSLLQILVCMESGFLFYASAFIAKIDITTAAAAITVIIGVLVLYWEHSLGKISSQPISNTKTAITLSKSEGETITSQLMS